MSSKGCLCCSRGSIARSTPLRLNRAVAYERWLDGYLDRAAELITDAYRNHVDSRINDQYRSVAGARRFLYHILPSIRAAACSSMTPPWWPGSGERAGFAA